MGRKSGVKAGKMGKDGKEKKRKGEKRKRAGASELGGRLPPSAEEDGRP